MKKVLLLAVAFLLTACSRMPENGEYYLLSSVDSSPVTIAIEDTTAYISDGFGRFPFSIEESKDRNVYALHHKGQQAITFFLEFDSGVVNLYRHGKVVATTEEAE